MGSGSNRKQSDVVILRPRTSKGATGIGGGKSEKLHCPSSFKSFLPQDKVLTEGLTLNLKQQNDKLAITANGKIVHYLSETLSKKLLLCIHARFRYSGIVKKRNNQYYGNFQRSN